MWQLRTTFLSIITIGTLLCASLANAAQPQQTAAKQPVPKPLHAPARTTPTKAKPNFPTEFFLATPNIHKLTKPIASAPVTIRNEGLICDAVLIRNQWALASYCSLQDPTNMVATYGTGPTQQRVGIQKVYSNDALVLYHLSDPILAPVDSLPGSADPIPSTGEVTFVAQGLPWGINNGQIMVDDPETLYAETQKLRPLSYCEQNANSNERYQDRSTMLCTGTRNPTYHTDMPEFCWRLGGSGRLYTTIFGKPSLIGLTSGRNIRVSHFQYYASCHAYPESHIFLGTYRDWIDDTIVRNQDKDREFNSATGKLEPVPSKRSLTVEPTPATPRHIPQDSHFIAYQPETDPAQGSLTSITIARLRKALSAKYSQQARNDGTVLLASEASFADALAASPLLKNRYLLLNSPSHLEPEILAELHKLDANQVVLLGGSNALSPLIDQQLHLAGFKTRRIAGSNREETAALIHQEFVRTHEVTKKPWPLFLARAYGEGTAAFADSIALGAAAVRTDRPILLTGNTVPTPYLGAEVQQAMQDSERNRGNVFVTLVGGSTAIPIPIDLGIRSAFPKWELNRQHGHNRFETAVALGQLTSETDGLMLTDGVSANAWQAGFAATPIAYDLNAAMYLLNEDSIPVETQRILEQYRNSGKKKVPVVCLASTTACNKVREFLRMR